jgi:hypothetical protein
MLAAVPDRGFFITMQAIRRQLMAMPCDLYSVHLIHHASNRAFPGERLWTASDLTRSAVVRFLRLRNSEGCDIYIRPYADDQNAGYILLDLDRAHPEILEAMCIDGHDPCVLLRTSPGHLQAWIHVSTLPLRPAEATAIGKQLARAYGADLASTDWRHLGRLAGFTNQKPQRRIRGFAPWVRVLHAHAGLARLANDLLESARRRMTTADPVDCEPSVGCHAPRSSRAVPTLTKAGAISVYQRWIDQWQIRQRFAQPDWSIVDLWVARQLLRLSIPAEQVKAVLRLGSPHFPRGHADPENYLHRTFMRATCSGLSPRPVCPMPANTPIMEIDSNASSLSMGQQMI